MSRPTQRQPRRAGVAGNRGFSLVELIVVILIAGLVAGAIFQVLVSNQRFYTAHGETVRGQQTVRAAVDFLATELREISPRDGDILSLDDDALTVRSMRQAAVVCAIADAPQGRVFATDLSDRPLLGEDEDSDDEASGSVEVLVWVQDESSSSQGTWQVATVTNRDSSGTCGDVPTVRYTLSGVNLESGAPRVRDGSLMRVFEEVEFGLVQESGQTYVGRGIDGGSLDPLVGPVDRDRGLEFEYFAADGNATTDPSLVRRIRVTVRTISDARDSGGRQIADSLSVLVTPRN